MDKDMDHQEYEQCKVELLNALTDRSHPWRIVSFSNVSLKGEPVNRFVVLRDVKGHDLVFFTDIRSNKIEAIVQRPMISLCFYHPDKEIQLQIKAKATLHHQDDVTLREWEEMSAGSRVCYHMVEEPGEVLDEPFFLKPDSMTIEEAYEYFGVVHCRSVEWEILKLNRSGNQRTRIKIDEKDGEVIEYLAP